MMAASAPISTSSILCADLAAVSDAIYTPGFVWTVPKIVPGARIKHFPIDRNLVKYAMVEVEDLTIVAFRGSVGSPFGGPSWKVNYQVRLIQIPFGIKSFVHKGFFSAARRAMASLQPHLPRDRPLLVCGHSQGGAVALCLAMLARRSLRLEASAVTFGQPRAVNGGLARYVDLYTDIAGPRFTLRGDPIPVAFPPPMPYAHCGKHVHFLDQDGTTGPRRSWPAMRGPRAWHAAARYATATRAAANRMRGAPF